MRDSFKKTIKDNGQSFKWFYDKYAKGKSCLTYSGFMQQINEYAPLSPFVTSAITEYMERFENA